MACPFCNSDESCEHHLLTVDIYEQKALGGALYELFDARCEALRPTADEEDEDFDEDRFHDRLAEAFGRCLEEAEALATGGDIEEVDTMWGMGVSSQLNLYCSTPSELDAAVRRYRELSESCSAP